MMIKDAIRFNYLFRGLDEQQIDQVSAMGEVEKFHGGDVMIRQFDRSNDLLILVEGSAIIRAFSGETLAEVGIGSVLGEVSLIDEQPRSATVVSAGESTAIVLRGSKLQEAMKRDPVLRAVLVTNLARLLCHRLRAANIQLDTALASATKADATAGS